MECDNINIFFLKRWLACIMIKAVLFDFDGVLTIDKTGSATVINYIANTCGISHEIVKSSYYQFNKRLLLGETTHQEVWKDFCKSLGQAIDYHILLDSFRSTRLDEKMIDLVRELRKNYLVGMVTDNKSDRIDTILDDRGLSQLFDIVAISSCVHARKDSRTIFEYVLDTLNVQPSECVFIDNSENNLSVPKQMGMHTLLFDDENRDHALFLHNLFEILS